MTADEWELWRQVYVAVVAKQGCTWETAEYAANEAVAAVRRAVKQWGG
jgi:hypothetical protein